MTKQAWRDIPAGRDLDRIVAETLGWTSVAYDRDATCLLGHPPGERMVIDAVPSYSTSVDVALTLIPEGVSFELDNDANGMCDYDEWEGIVNGYYGDADEPALAIVRAWLVYMDEECHDEQ